MMRDVKGTLRQLLCRHENFTELSQLLCVGIYFNN